MPENTTVQEFNVDAALAQLEEINRKLGSDTISLSESLKLYKEGVQLASKCQEHLVGVEKELQIINDNE